MKKSFTDTENLSSALRARSIDQNRRFLMANFAGSLQEDDISDPVNCAGYGRVRHFTRKTNSPWPANTLPIDPALRKLGLPAADIVRAQVFQNAACNWRCWYCYVPFDRLSADEKVSGWFSAHELVEKYAAEPNRGFLLDLSGGQPDLIPEWIPDTMRAIRHCGIEEQTYLWSDDNLSNDYFWRFLDSDELKLIQEYPRYGRVACFKGFDEASFAYNTGASPEVFSQQFTLFKRLMELRMDLYAYATFTGVAFRPTAMRDFVDRLQRVSEALPLRTIPLEISAYSVVRERLKGPIAKEILDVQLGAIDAWNVELERRFTTSERAGSICDVMIGK